MVRPLCFEGDEHECHHVGGGVKSMWVMNSVVCFMIITSGREEGYLGEERRSSWSPTSGLGQLEELGPLPELSQSQKADIMGR